MEIGGSSGGSSPEVTPGVKMMKLTKNTSNWTNEVKINTYDLMLENERMYISTTNFSVNSTDVIPTEGNSNFVRVMDPIITINNTNSLFNTDGKIATFVDVNNAARRISVCKTNAAGNPISFGIIKLDNLDFKAPTINVGKGPEFTDFYMLDLNTTEAGMLSSEAGSGLSEIKWAIGPFSNNDGTEMIPNVNYFEIAGNTIDDVSNPSSISIKIMPKSSPIYIYARDKAGNFTIVKYTQ